MKRARPTRVRVAHAVALCAAVAALALALREVPSFFLGLALLAAGALAMPFAEWTSVPPRLARALPRVLGMTLLAIAGVAWLSRALGVLVLEPTFVPMMAAPFLVPMAAVFALAPRAFPTGRTLLPAVIYILGLAGLNPAPAGYGPSALPFLRGGDHNAFAEPYLVLALVVLGALWAGALLESGPRWQPARRARARPGRRPRGGCWPRPASWVCRFSSRRSSGPWPRPSTRERRACRASPRSGSSRSWPCRAAASSTCERPTRRPARGSCARRSSPTFDGRRWRNAARPARAVGPGSAGRSPTRRRPGSCRARSSPIPAPGSPAATAGATEDADEGRAAVEILVNQQDVGRWPLLLPHRVTRRDRRRALSGGGPIREHPAPGRPAGSPLRRAAGRRRAVRAHRSSDDDRSESLALPAVVDPRLRALAHGLAPGADPRGRLAATVAHLQGGYRYTLRPGAFRTGDPLAEFLFEKKAGYCEYFASAAVVLLRLQGVPARFVKGLSVGPQTDQGGGLHVVRDSDAHAWVEAWIPGEGWVEADPTPPGPFAEAHGRAGLLPAVPPARARRALRRRGLA